MKVTFLKKHLIILILRECSILNKLLIFFVKQEKPDYLFSRAKKKALNYPFKL